MTILVTGGAGFIGSNFVLDWVAEANELVVNLDKLTYAGNINNLSFVSDDDNHQFVKGDICDPNVLNTLLREHRPRAILHFAAESHVDRSIHGPAEFIRTNLVGTFTLLESVRSYWGELEGIDKRSFRYLHVSTDEVYGSLEATDPPFSETSPFAPNSPYSASKAGSDHLVRAYFHTYGLPVLTSNCSNNYGPYQFPEKLIPLMILNCLNERPLPVYGDGENIRDWLYVKDHCSAIRCVLDRGKPGATYNVGGRSELKNIDVVNSVCNLFDELSPQDSGQSRRDLITYVKDRPGHDRRYAIDAAKIEKELDWAPTESFESGLRKTIQWYLDNFEWLRNVESGAYREWISTNYGDAEVSQ